MISDPSQVLLDSVTILAQILKHTLEEEKQMVVQFGLFL